MRYFIIPGLVFLLLGPVLAWGEKPLKVIVTTTDLADIVRQIGGDTVHVESLSQGVQNPHFVEPKPSLVVKLMKADLFIQTGLELEIGWAPLLLQNSRNKKILPGAVGFLDASEAITPLDVSTNPTRAMGDVHPQGNPHYMADPKNALLVAKRIADKLSELSPENKAALQAAVDVFQKDIEERLATWATLLKPYQGAMYVSYHKDWIYFAERFGLVSMGEIEPKPGLPPTAPYIAQLINRMKAKQVRIVIMDPWYEDRSGLFISKETGASLVRLALFPGANPNVRTYQETVDYNVRAIAEALAKK